MRHSTPIKWEHQITLANNLQDAYGKLNAVGARGWEMVAALYVFDQFVLFLKRPAPRAKGDF